MIKYIIGSLIIALTLFSCETEFVNPGASTESDVVSSAKGLELLTKGLHRRWSVGRQSPVYTTISASGLSTGELRLINPGNISENDLSLGGTDVDGSNAIVNNLWQQSLLTRKESQTVLDNLSAVPSESLRSGIEAYASMFNGLANGTLATFFEQGTLVFEENAAFSPRQALLEAAINSLNSAVSAASKNPSYKQFDIDVTNASNALIARYQLMLGNYQAAIDAANKVNKSSKSTFTYDQVNTNPIAFVSILTNNVWQPKDLTLGLPDGLQPSADDQRLGFYFDNLNPDNSDFRAAAFFDGAQKSIPLYVPGEMDLIKAEANARLNKLGDAITALNAVLTKSPSDDLYGIGAGLPVYDGPEDKDAILMAIYTNRATELMLSGLRLEDSRRFGYSDDRNRNYYPYPFSERDNNTNTPADPD